MKPRLSPRMEKDIKKLNNLYAISPSFIEALESCIHDARYRTLLNSIHEDPRKTIGRHAIEAGLTYVEVAAAYNRVKKAEGLIAASHSIPRVMKDIAKAARTKREPCRDCDNGERKGKVCKTCGGKGEVEVEGDAESRKQFLKMTGVVEDRLIDARQVHQHMHIEGDEAVEDMIRSVRPLLEQKNE